MPYDWNQDFAGADPTDYSLICMFCDAIRERMIGGGYTAAEANAAVPYPVVGTTRPLAAGSLSPDYPAGRYTSLSGASTSATPVWAHLQRVTEFLLLGDATSAGGYHDFAGIDEATLDYPDPGGVYTDRWKCWWCDPDVSRFHTTPPGGSTPDAGMWLGRLSNTTGTWPSAFAKAGIPNGFTRRLPKEFATLTATKYRAFRTADAMDFVEGDKARCMADSMVYQRVGSAWVLCDPQTPPDTVIKRGFLCPGDWFGPWVFRELRDVLNVMTHIGNNASAEFYFKRAVRSAWSSPPSSSWTSQHYQAHRVYPTPTITFGLAAGSSGSGQCEYGHQLLGQDANNDTAIVTRYRPLIYWPAPGATVTWYRSASSTEVALGRLLSYLNLGATAQFDTFGGLVPPMDITPAHDWDYDAAPTTKHHVLESSTIDANGEAYGTWAGTLDSLPHRDWWMTHDPSILHNPPINTATIGPESWQTHWIQSDWVGAFKVYGVRIDLRPFYTYKPA